MHFYTIMSVIYIEVSFNQRHIRIKYRDIGRPDKGSAGTRDFGLKIGSSRKNRDGWQPQSSARFSLKRNSLARDAHLSVLRSVGPFVPAVNEMITGH
jgi:hypothetical protein